MFCFATKKIKNGFWPFVFPTWNSDARYIQTHNSFRIIFIGQVCKTHTEFVSEICLPPKFSVVWIFRSFFSLYFTHALNSHSIVYFSCHVGYPVPVSSLARRGPSVLPVWSGQCGAGGGRRQAATGHVSVPRFRWEHLSGMWGYLRFLKNLHRDPPVVLFNWMWKPNFSRF